MHEATRRVLGVLLRQMDGFQRTRSVVIGATNRRQDLDPALLSRFDASIAFQLPGAADRPASSPRARAGRLPVRQIAHCTHSHNHADP